MKKNGIGGTNTKTGIFFEKKVELATRLSKLSGYECIEEKYKKIKSKSYKIYFEKEFVAQTFQKHALYAFLKGRGIDWKKILSKKLLPDDTIYVIKDNTIYILEMKFQEVGGSVDEKLQTCDFKKKQYKKLFSQLNYEVEYIYILSNYYKIPKYKDVLDYIIAVNCSYFFEYLPLQKIGLAVPYEK
jgi:hypothetical protein